MGSDKRKQTFYFPAEVLVEIQAEAKRLDRSVSWVAQRAWKRARKEIKTLPSEVVRESQAKTTEEPPSAPQG